MRLLAPDEALDVIQEAPEKNARDSYRYSMTRPAGKSKGFWITRRKKLEA